MTVRLTRAAARDLDHLPSSDRDPVTQDLRTFAFPLYRLRSGDYRVLYRIDEAAVTVMRVINRKDLERTLRQLRLSRP